MSKSSTGQHEWIIRKLSSKKYSLEELVTAWKQEKNKSRSTRTIQRWISDVQKNHNILIICDNNEYYIADKGNFKKYDTEKWIAYSTKINDLIIEHDDIQDKILIDNIPSENQYLEEILNAISSQLTVKISYTKYSSDDSRNLEKHQYTIHPYCVKRFENRWYVTGLVVKKAGKDCHQIQTFSLDMINELNLQKRKFKQDPSFNASEYFENVYGITTGDNGSLTKIKIRTTSKRANYLRKLPFHPSQKEVGESNSYNVFQYELKPARDFYQALLHLGPDVEVLSPESVRNEMKKLIQEMAEKYGLTLNANTVHAQ